MTKALITGSGGFLGSHLADGLRTHYELLLPTRSQLDVCDQRAVETYFWAQQPNIVFHLAASVSSTASGEDMEAININGTEHVVRAAQESGVSAVVVAGSCAEYGNASTPFTEDMHASPLSLYAKTKREATQIALATDLPVCVLRMTNVYGPRSSHDLVAKLLHAARTHARVSVSDTLFRDYIYVSDVVDAFIRAAERIGTVRGNIINISSGSAISTRDLATMAARILGLDGSALIAEAPYVPKETDQLSNESSNQKARALLDWTPQITLEEGMRRTFSQS